MFLLAALSIYTFYQSYPIYPQIVFYYNTRYQFFNHKSDKNWIEYMLLLVHKVSTT